MLQSLIIQLIARVHRLTQVVAKISDKITVGFTPAFALGFRLGGGMAYSHTPGTNLPPRKLKTDWAAGNFCLSSP